MKKIFYLIILAVFFFTSCPGVYTPVHKHSVARIKEKYDCAITLINASSKAIQFKYAPVPYQKNIETNLPFYSEYVNNIGDKLAALSLKGGGSPAFDTGCYYLNVFGSLNKNDSAVLYTGIDGGTYAPDNIMEIYPNSNVDGLPARFVLMIDGDTTCYSLVYNCKSHKDNSENQVVITDDTIAALSKISEDDFDCGYNWRRRWYGKSVTVQDRLYCFEKVDLKKNSLVDYTYSEDLEFTVWFSYPGMHFTNAMYGRIYFFTGLGEPSEVLVYYNENNKKFYYVTSEINPVVEAIN